MYSLFNKGKQNNIPRLLEDRVFAFLIKLCNIFLLDSNLIVVFFSSFSFANIIIFFMYLYQKHRIKIVPVPNP